MRGPRRIFALALVALAVFAAAGCGGDKEGKGIPVATADRLHNQLDNVQARIDQGSAGACKDIIEAPASRGSNKQQVQDLIDSLPDDVDADVKSALQDSFDHLWDLVEQDCQDKANKTQTNTTPTETQTTPTETQTETTPTATETTPTTPTTTETSPDNAPLPNDGNGNGNGGVPGAGNGGGVGPSAEKQGKEKKK
jgi:hypothetical protein